MTKSLMMIAVIAVVATTTSCSNSELEDVNSQFERMQSDGSTKTEKKKVPKYFNLHGGSIMDKYTFEN